MKRTILILFILLLPIGIFSQESTLRNPNKFDMEGKGSFSAEVIRALQITNESSYINLGFFNPGETKFYSSSDEVMEFFISGELNKIIKLTVTLSVGVEGIQLKDGALESLSFGVWDPLPFTIETDSDNLLYNTEFKFEIENERVFRFYPLEVEASGDFSRINDSIILIILVNCEYKDL
jgi:hypothetical protein